MALVEVGKRARFAAQQLSGFSSEKRRQILSSVHQALESSREEIEEANRADIEESKGVISDSLLKRLDLCGPKFDHALEGLKELIDRSDPVGVVTLARELDQDLELYRVTCPLGVVCVIFESRPDAAIQIPSLTLKSANALILKGGREANRTNSAIVRAIRCGLESSQAPIDAVQLVTTREEVSALLSLDEYIDLVIPRGSKELVRHIMDNSRIPVMGHADGICSVFVDEAADMGKAIRVVVDAKTQYTAVCNATETLLLHTSCTKSIWPELAKTLFDKGVSMHIDEVAWNSLLDCEINPEELSCLRATMDDYHTEFLDLSIAVKVVENLQEAIDHINHYGSHHTDAIITENPVAASIFLQRVDSGNVNWNASTRFADGFRYGFGAEVGVSTNRIHARGPVGVEGLLIYKYLVLGMGEAGHIVADYTNVAERSFTHRELDSRRLFERFPSLGLE